MALERAGGVVSDAGGALTRPKADLSHQGGVT
jgi:hypothetical protein